MRCAGDDRRPEKLVRVELDSCIVELCGASRYVTQRDAMQQDEKLGVPENRLQSAVTEFGEARVSHAARRQRRAQRLKSAQRIMVEARRIKIGD